MHAHAFLLRPPFAHTHTGLVGSWARVCIWRPCASSAYAVLAFTMQDQNTRHWDSLVPLFCK